MDITIIGSVPSKKNSNKVSCSRGFPQTYKTAKFKEWHEDAMKQLKLSCKGVKPLEKTSSITMTFYAPNKRKFDLDNRCGSVMDLLVDAGILEDDNWEVCPCIQLVFGGVDYKKPRAEIEII